MWISGGFKKKEKKEKQQQRTNKCDGFLLFQQSYFDPFPWKRTIIHAFWGSVPCTGNFVLSSILFWEDYFLKFPRNSAGPEGTGPQLADDVHLS